MPPNRLHMLFTPTRRPYSLILPGAPALPRLVAAVRPGARVPARVRRGCVRVCGRVGGAGVLLGFLYVALPTLVFIQEPLSKDGRVIVVGGPND